MNWESKVFFLTLVRDNRFQLFSHLNNQLNDAAKEENWRRIFEQCQAAGCNGLRSVDFLRKTTWQNLRRRFEAKYERSKIEPPGTVEFDQLDELIREALGRDVDLACKVDRSIFEQFNLDNFELPLNSPGTFFVPHIDLNPSSSDECTQLTANDIHDKKDDFLMNLEELTKKITENQQQNENAVPTEDEIKEDSPASTEPNPSSTDPLELDTSPPTLRVAPIPTPTSFTPGGFGPPLKRRRASQQHPNGFRLPSLQSQPQQPPQPQQQPPQPQQRSAAQKDMDLAQLEREKLLAEIKWLEADTQLKLVQKRNAELEAEMKQLQYFKLQRETATEMGLL